MARTGTTLALPPFSGATRRLILILIGVFFADALLARVLPQRMYDLLFGHLALVPAEVLHGQIWQLLSYCVLPLGIVGTLFGALTIWFFGSMLEDLRGQRWLAELFLTSSVGGAVVGCLVAYTHLFGMRPELASEVGPYTGIYGLFIAVAVLLGDVEFLFLFIVRIKAKYLVAIYVLINIATLLKASNAFGALMHLCGALAGYFYLRYAPRRGYGFSVTEPYFALRNAFYRSKRRRAAKKFEVYMRKQNRDVHFDSNGRYIEPDDRDQNDKRWMN